MMGSLMLCATAACLFGTAATGYEIRALDVSEVKVTGGFWKPRIETNRIVTIPTDFRKCEETGRIANFEKAGRREKGGFKGFRFDDSDVFKVIEGAAYSLAQTPDSALDGYLDGLIAKIASAQEADGYLYTARTLGAADCGTGTNRWSNLSDSHELYNVGHLYEAAAAHYQATGKTNLLAVATRNADLLVKTFGLGHGMVRDIPGHEEVEVGLFRLYHVTGRQEYRDLARLFIDLRGRKDLRAKALYGDQIQDHLPVTNQTEAVGHAVRAGYLYCGLADLAAETGCADYRRAVDQLWENVVGHKLHLSGGIGARPTGEAFGSNDELPNRSAYLETCASIANALWNYRMFRLHGDAKYLDVLERVLYNGFLSGVSLSGDTFFYPNPLSAAAGRSRQKWFGCSCCPVNVARFMPQVGSMAYALCGDTVFCNLFIDSEVTLRLPSGKVHLVQKTEYPWQGDVSLTIGEVESREFELRIRRPGWVDGKPVPSSLYRTLDPVDAADFAVELNGQPAAYRMDKGFAVLRRVWRSGDRVQLRMRLKPRKVVSAEAVAENRGRVAFERGPIVYCAEAADNDGSALDRIVDADSPVSVGERVIEGVRVPSLSVRGRKVRATGLWTREASPCGVVLVPYSFWCHRGSGEMQVWQGTDPAHADLRPRLTASVSHCWKNDNPAAMCDGIRPLTSHENTPRMTFWPHRGTQEWAQYTLDAPERVAGFRICWYDDGNAGHCRIPASCRILVRTADAEPWRDVGISCPLVKDEFSVLRFPEPVLMKAIRLEIGLKQDCSGGILEWELLPEALATPVKVTIEPSKVKAEVSPWLYGTGMEDVNHEIYGGLDAQRLFGESFEETCPTGCDSPKREGVSGCWDKAEALDGGDFIRDTKVKHQGEASQALVPNGGVAAIANRGLRGWGIPCRAGRKMKGCLWVRGRVDSLEVALQDTWGERTYATAVLPLPNVDAWRKVDFALVPQASDAHGRFLIRASGQGKVWVDDAYLADEPTNVFGELGCREDIVDGFRNEGVTFLRWGGTMANAKAYRLKNMRGKGERMPYSGFWYREASGGFGPYEFVRMANAMRLPCAVSISAYEDTADAVAFAHELKSIEVPVFVQIGNEELTGWGQNPEDKRTYAGVTNYCASAKRIVTAMRAENPKLKFVHAGMWFDATHDINLLEEAFHLLDGVVEYWDIHVMLTDPASARRNRSLPETALKCFRKWNPKTTMKVAVFEENGNNHGLDRALGHAVMLEKAREMGRDILTSCPANALQPYLHNDNWWDQGSVFFTPTQVWLSPCGQAQKMASTYHRELLVESSCSDDELSVSATRSRDGRSIVVHLVNSDQIGRQIELSCIGMDGLKLRKAVSLSGPNKRADNPPENPLRIAPKDVTADFGTSKRIKPFSYTVLVYE